MLCFLSVVKSADPREPGVAREAMPDGELEWKGRMKTFEGMDSKKEKE